MEKKKFKAVELKYLDEKTIGQIREWRNADFVREMSFTRHIITPEEHASFIQGIKDNPDKGLFVFYFDDEPVAVFHYVLHKKTNHVTGSHYLTNENFKYEGYGEVVAYLIKSIIFHIIKADYELSEILDTNKKLLATCKKGDLIVGVSKDHVSIDGQYHDVYQVKYTKEYYLSRPDWYKKLIYNIVQEENIENCVLY